MGRLIHFSPEDRQALSAAWTCHKMASRPEHKNWRAAMRLEDHLIEVTEPESGSIKLKFAECGLMHDLAASDIDQAHPDLSVYFLGRSMPASVIASGVGVDLLLENDEFEYLKTLIAKITPMPASIRHFIRLEDMLADDAIAVKVDLQKLAKEAADRKALAAAAE